MPNQVSVNPEHADKVVFNGVDLLNREQLSRSQNRELQRYIDANAHLLGFGDKEKEAKEKEHSSTHTHSSYNSYSLGHTPRNYYSSGGGADSGASVGAGDYDSSTAYPRATQSLGRVHSPAASDYSGKRKGVSWSDGVEKKTGDATRARSHSPKRETDTDTIGTNSNRSSYLDSAGGGNNLRNYPNSNYNSQPTQNGVGGGGGSDYASPHSRLYSPAYSTSDKRRTPYDFSTMSGGGADSPWGDNWSRASRDSFPAVGDDHNTWRGFPKNDQSTYSTLDRNPDNYNRYETMRFREQQSRKSQERDESIKFYGFGDHRVSGLEMKPKRWTGGEVVTDPNLINKSLKPRRLFYSPIGDGVVAADGIEWKPGPPDLTPRISVRHERIVERGRGQAGHRLYEQVWDEGDGRGADDGAGDFGPIRTPFGDGLGDGDGGPRKPRGAGDDDGGPKRPADDGGGGPRRKDDGWRPSAGDYGGGPPYDDGRGKQQPPYGDNNNDDGLSGPRSRPPSALSIGTDGHPREGWTKTFIVNPRELINQYGMETPTTIFDLEDHTPKTYTTYKETVSEVVD